MQQKDENKMVSSENGDELYYGVGSFLWEIVKVFFWALVIIVPIRIFLFQPFFVQGSSMIPNFHDSDYLIVNEFGYKITNFDFFGFHFAKAGSFREFSRQDVVVFKFPKNPEQFFIKRVLGLPGERIKIVDSKVTIYNLEHPDGIIIDESSYLTGNLRTNGTIDLTLKDDEYFVMGDNREFSNDSRFWGPVPKDKVIGRVLLRAWPLNKIEVL